MSISVSYTPKWRTSVGRPAMMAQNVLNAAASNNLQKLPISVDLRPCETLTSVASHLAMANGVISIQEFCNDFKLNWSKLRNGNRDELINFSLLSGIPVPKLEQACLVRLGVHSYSLSGYNFGAKHLCISNTKICPTCLIEDLEIGAPLGRLDWELTAYRTCHKHQIPMSILPGVIRPRCNYDFQNRIRDHLSKIKKQAENGEKNLADNAFEEYVFNRFVGNIDNRWLDQWDLGVLVEAVENLGTVLVHGRDVFTDKLTFEDLRDANSVGFSVISNGPTAILDVLKKTSRVSTAQRPSFVTDFGVFARWLIRANVTNDRYAKIIDIVSEFAFETYPFQKGDIFLGRTCVERKIHNLPSVAAEYGLNHSRAARLVQSLSLKPNVDSGQVLIKATEFDPVLRNFSECINGSDLAKKLGIPGSMMKRFLTAKFIKPRFDLEKLAALYHPHDVDALLEKLVRCSRRLPQVPEGCYHLSEASARAKRLFEDVLKLCLAKRVTSLCYVAKTPKLCDFYVDRDEVLDLCQTVEPMGYSKEQLRKFLRINTSTIPMIIKRGYLTCELIEHHRSRKPSSLIRISEIASFLKKFSTLGMMANNVGLQAVHVARKLESRDTKPIEFNDPRYSKIFDRLAVEKSGLAEEYLKNWTYDDIEEALL